VAAGDMALTGGIAARSSDCVSACVWYSMEVLRQLIVCRSWRACCSQWRVTGSMTFVAEEGGLRHTTVCGLCNGTSAFATDHDVLVLPSVLCSMVCVTNGEEARLVLLRKKIFAALTCSSITYCWVLIKCKGLLIGLNTDTVRHYRK
jgi:hypothetical protein